MQFTIKNEYRTGNMPVTLKVDTVKSDCREESTVFQLGMCACTMYAPVWLDLVMVVASVVYSNTVRSGNGRYLCKYPCVWSLLH